ncbi:MAG: Type 1 glutamine amidotransferase-like domain-containing protein [Candidatus Saccharibacteria bacterium]|nr:Type 1 glutamine amidotransferase-like domain-containing protein [Candidatus Saccharibacteria bacterium]
MRLYLTSHNLGPYKDELLRLVGTGRKVLYIENARDYYPDEKRANDLQEKLAMLSELGFEAEELNLRDYFGEPDKLRIFIDSYKPDLIFVSGGNVFLLATAYHLSGFDEILRQDLAEDKYVYGGFSAGTMVICKELEIYGGHAYLIPDVVKEIYGVDSTMKGVGLLDYQLVPHADLPKWIDGTKEFVRRIKAAGLTPRLLNQEAVIIVDDNGEFLLEQ